MRKSNFEGRTALITGGSSGIGLALAQELSAAGANVWILSRDQTRLEDACQQVKASARSAQQQVLGLSADVTDNASLSAQLQPLIHQLGAPDYLINSAGTTFPAYFTDVPLDMHRQNMDVNYFGTLNCINLVLPAMLARKSGHIINLSSIVGYHGILGYSSYSPSKFAVRGLSDVLYYELKPHGIKVSVVFPPDTDTRGFQEENKTKPLLVKVLSESNNKVMQPADVAHNILRSVQRGHYLICPGFDSAFFYTLNSLPWHLPYWIMNFLIADARRKTRKYEAGQ